MQNSLSNNFYREKPGIELWGFVLYLAFIFLNPQVFFPVIQPFRPALIIALVTFLICFLEKKVLCFHPLQSKLLILFLITTSFSTLEALDVTRSFIFLQIYVKGVILYFLFYMITSLELNLIKILKVMIFFLFINTVITLIQQKMGLMPYRIHSFDGQGPNDYALIILSMLPFPIHLMEIEKSKSKKAYYALVILSYLLCLTRTRSRMGFVGLVILLTQIIWIKRQNFKAILIIGILVIITLLNVHHGYFERITTISDDSAKRSRTLLWNQAIELMKLRPYLGVGPGNFVTGKIHFGFEGNKFHIAHNAFLEVGAENGVIAMAIYVLIMLISLRHLLLAERKFKDHRAADMLGLCQAARMAFITLSFTMLFLSQQYNHFYYIFAAMSAVLRNFAAEEGKK